MLRALSTPKNRMVTLVFLAVCCAAAIVAGVIGIDDNPAGILLAFLAVTAFALTFVHPWRTAKPFGLLLGASILAFVISGILHNLIEGLADRLGTDGILLVVLQGTSFATFLLAVLVCPPAFVVGSVGVIVMLIRSHQRTKQAHVGTT